MPRSKDYCVKNQKTKRCIKSVSANETSSMCKLFNKTQRCRSLKADTVFVTFKSYKMKASVGISKS